MSMGPRAGGEIIEYILSTIPPPAMRGACGDYIRALALPVPRVIDATRHGSTPLSHRRTRHGAPHAARGPALRKI